MNDAEIDAKIAALEAEQREIRARDTHGAPRPDAELDRLGQIKVELDRLWDLTRQRRAKEEFGQDPDTAEERPAAQVERYGA